MKKTKHTLITAQILGFFTILIAILALLTNKPIFRIAALILFFLVLIVTGTFAVFATLAVKEHKKHDVKKNKNILDKTT